MGWPVTPTSISGKLVQPEAFSMLNCEPGPAAAAGTRTSLPAPSAESTRSPRASRKELPWTVTDQSAFGPESPAGTTLPWASRAR